MLSHFRLNPEWVCGHLVHCCCHQMWVCQAWKLSGPWWMCKGVYSVWNLQSIRHTDNRQFSVTAGHTGYRADSRLAPSQWETALLCNNISHWLGTNLESALGYAVDLHQHSHMGYCLHLHCQGSVNSLWPSVIIWQMYRLGTTLAPVMSCCLMSPSHYLNQCWLLISEVMWHSHQRNFTVSTQANIIIILCMMSLKMIATSHRGQWVYHMWSQS